MGMVKVRSSKKKPDNLNLKDKLKNKLRSNFKGLPVNRALVKSSKSVLLSPKNRKRILNLLLVASIFLIIVVAIFGQPRQAELPDVLIYSKENSEDIFTGILAEIEQNPLSGLLGDKLPTEEEIFYAEWANDWFPHIDVPIVGSIIEEMGAEKVGDVDFDSLAPFCDLNMTSHANPSNLSLAQCAALWNPNDPYSFLAESPDLWYAALTNDLASISVLIGYFNLSYAQCDLILDWLNTSTTGWMSNIADSVFPIPESSILLALGVIALSVVAGDYLYHRNYYVDTIKGKLERRREEKLKAKRVEAEKLRVERIMAEKRRLIEAKKMEAKRRALAEEPSESPETGVAPPAAIPAVTPPETLTPSWLECPTCGVPGVVMSLQVSASNAVLKIVCPTDNKSYTTKLPLVISNEWIKEVAEQVLRCRVCGQRVQKPERVITKGPWVILFVNCPTHGMREPQRQIFHTLYPALSKALEKISKKSGGGGV